VKSDWIFYTSSNREIPKIPELLSWRKHSWYNIHEYIKFNDSNLDENLIFEDIKSINTIQPNPLDRSLWRLQDYKTEIKELKETYAYSGNIQLSKCFIQVISLRCNFFTFVTFFLGSWSYGHGKQVEI